MPKRRKGGLSGVSNFMHAMNTRAAETAKGPDLEGGLQKKGEVTEESGSMAKRRKTDTTDTAREAEPSWTKKYDETGMVPHYTHRDQVPPHLQKYFSQRYRYFSMYSTPPGCLLDEEGWYSVTPELVADQIATRCRCDTILDAFCGVGGNAIAFAKTCQRVIALDVSRTRLALARHNAEIYGVADRIEFVLADFFSFVKAYGALPSNPQSDQLNATRRKIDVVFLSPPWGGPSYLEGSPEDVQDVRTLSTPDEYHSYSLSSIRPVNGSELFHISRTITKNIGYYLPRNTRVKEISELLSEAGKDIEDERVEIEEEWMGNKLKALTCYFGGLVQGQEDRF